MTPINCPVHGTPMLMVDTPSSVQVVAWDDVADVRGKCPMSGCGERVAVRVLWRRAGQRDTLEAA